MRQLLWEGKKNPIPAGFLLGLLVVLLFLNWAVAEKEISRLRAGNTEEYYRGQDRAYATVEGTITTANMEWVVSEKNRLDTLILGGIFPPRKIQNTPIPGMPTPTITFFKSYMQMRSMHTTMVLSRQMW